MVYFPSYDVIVNSKEMHKIQRNISGLQMLSNMDVSLLEHVSEDESASTEEEKN